MNCSFAVSINLNYSKNIEFPNLELAVEIIFQIGKLVSSNYRLSGSCLLVGLGQLLEKPLNICLKLLYSFPQCLQIYLS